SPKPRSDDTLFCWGIDKATSSRNVLPPCLSIKGKARGNGSFNIDRSILGIAASLRLFYKTRPFRGVKHDHAVFVRKNHQTSFKTFSFLIIGDCHSSSIGICNDSKSYVSCGVVHYAWVPGSC